MKIKKLILLLIVSVLTNYIFADIPIGGPSGSYPLGISSFFNPSEEPLFMLSVNSQNIDYNQSSIQYETYDYDLSLSNTSENFSLYVLSNFSSGHWKWTDFEYYYLTITFSNNFVPVEDSEFDNEEYPLVYINFIDNLNTSTYNYFSYGWGVGKYIYMDSINQGASASISYGSREVQSKKYGYYIYIPSGYTSEEIIDFSFTWDGYTQSVTKYWDMEAYVRVELESI